MTARTALYITDRDGIPVYNVMFIRTHDDVPVFHRFDAIVAATHDLPIERWAVHMACGREVTYIDLARVAYKHARKFGRPCQGCFGRRIIQEST